MRPSTGRISLWPVAVVAFVLVLAALSITPTLKLKAMPPSDFVGPKASAATPQAKLAEEYWGVAVRVIQWKYNRGEALPESVPEDFRLPHDTAQVTLTEDHAARIAYWSKLREDWLRPESWQTTFKFDFSWPARTAQNVTREVLQFIHQT